MTDQEKNMQVPHVCTLGCSIPATDHLPKGGSFAGTITMSPVIEQRLEDMHSVIGEVEDEIARAIRIYQPLNSPHEAHSVILEELDEFWDEVKAYNLRKGRDTRPRMREELIQLAAMAVRAITDVIDNGRPEGELNDPFHDEGNATNHRMSQCTERCREA